MDAKPQRPRALRVHDENMPLPLMNGPAPGKALHQRTKSTPAFSTVLQAGAVKATNRKVLGEANVNAKIVQPAKDDSALGKKAMSEAVELVKPAAVFARPATRPLTTKSQSAQNMPTTVTTAIVPAVTKPQIPEQVYEPVPELIKKVAAKKSAKVLKDAAVSQPEGDTKKPAITAPVHQTFAAPKISASTVVQQVPAEVQGGIAVQRQEVRKTETVPLRDDPAPRPLVQAAASVSQSMPQSVVSDQEYMFYLQAQANQLHMPNTQFDQGIKTQAPYFPAQPQVQQYYEEDEEEYYYEEGFTTARSFGLRGDSTGGVTTILAPKYTDKAQQELAAAKAWVENARTAEEVEDEQWDISMVAEYGEEIFQYMRGLEARMSPNPRYMDQQTEIQWSMRAVLMDWVVQVHQRFGLLPETLFLTVNYIDRFLSCKVVSLGKLQLVGATAIFVASKYEEVNCPTIGEIIYMVDGGYSSDELLKAERFMLSMLQFELGWPGPMSFLRRISKADDYDLETRTLAKYFLEITIMDERFVGCTPSFLAAGAHCMARLMLRKGDWTQAHVYYSNYTFRQLRQILNAILECCEAPDKHHMAIFEKYKDKRYKRASIFVETEMAKGFVLPAYARGSSLGAFDAVNGWLRQC